MSSVHSHHDSDSSLDSRVVLLSERDSLALEWELHHTRWLLKSSQATASGAANSRRMPPLQPGQRVAHYETSPEEFNEHMEQRWEKVLGHLNDLLHGYDDERAWWVANKETAPLNTLRRAVRDMMAAGGGAAVDEGEFGITDAELGKDEPDPPKTIRSLRWLLAVRAEIARRRIMTGEVFSLMRTGRERGVAWTEDRMAMLSHRISEASYTDEGVAGISTRELLGLVQRRESAAAAFDVTGVHKAPPLLNMDALGAAEHEEVPPTSS